MSTQIKIPRKAKTKKGNDIHKLPPAYPAIEQYEKEFKSGYVEIIKKNFINKLKSIME